jgi:hypothetical protein
MSLAVHLSTMIVGQGVDTRSSVERRCVRSGRGGFCPRIAAVVAVAVTLLGRPSSPDIGPDEGTRDILFLVL